MEQLSREKLPIPAHAGHSKLKYWRRSKGILLQLRVDLPFFPPAVTKPAGLKFVQSTAKLPILSTGPVIHCYPIGPLQVIWVQKVPGIVSHVLQERHKSNCLVKCMSEVVLISSVVRFLVNLRYRPRGVQRFGLPANTLIPLIPLNCDPSQLAGDADGDKNSFLQFINT